MHAQESLIARANLECRTADPAHAIVCFELVSLVRAPTLRHVLPSLDTFAPGALTVSESEERSAEHMEASEDAQTLHVTISSAQHELTMTLNESYEDLL